MKKVNKKIVKLISEINIDKTDRLGDIIAPLLFKNCDCALFLSTTQKSVEVLLPPNSNQKKLHEKFLLLTELVTLLKYLEKERLIFLIQQQETLLSEFYYQNKKDYSTTQTEFVIKINKNEFLQGNELHSVCVGEKVVLQTTFPITTVLYSDLIYYLNSIVYPTAELKEYINRNFKSEDLYISRKSILVSRISIYIAVFIAVISPLVSLYLCNNYGITKLDEFQFKKIINHISLTREVKIECDTLINKNLYE